MEKPTLKTKTLGSLINNTSRKIKTTLAAAIFFATTISAASAINCGQETTAYRNCTQYSNIKDTCQCYAQLYYTKRNKCFPEKTPDPQECIQEALEENKCIIPDALEYCISYLSDNDCETIKQKKDIPNICRPYRVNYLRQN